MEKKHIAIFASGKGTNAKKLIDHFRNNSTAEISLVVCNNEKAEVLSISSQEKIPSLQ